MRYYRSSSRHNRPKPPSYSASRLFNHPSGATVLYQTKNIGYGFTHYQAVGTFEEISAWVESTLGSYPNNPYGTWFMWPPSDPVEPARGSTGSFDLGDGLWLVLGSHSNTSD